MAEPRCPGGADNPENVSMASWMVHRPLFAGLVLAMALHGGAMAAEQLVVGSWGGVWDDTVTKNIIAPLVAETGAEVSIVPGTSTEQLARILASPSAPPVDVLFIDLDVAAAAFPRQAFEVLTAADIPNLAKAYPAASYGDGQAVAQSFGAVTIVYDEKQVPSVDSWKALLDPALRGRISISPVDTWGFHVLGAFGQLAGKGPNDLDAGFQQLAIAAPRALVLGRDSELRQLFERGEIALATMYSGEAYVMKTAGLGSIRMAKPREGMIAVPNLLAIPKGSRNPALAHKFIDHALSAASQRAFALEYASAPSVRDVPLPDDLRAWMPATAEEFDRLIRPDWVVLNRDRDSLVQRWNTEVVPFVGTER